MKLTKYLTAALLAVAGLGLVVPSAKAQNPYHTPGDLVLFFQNPNGVTGSDKQLYVSLGNTATVFRDAWVNQVNVLNIININLELQTFGTNWADITTLFGGAGGCWGSSSWSNALQNGDPHRTFYTTQRRESTGTVGMANSTGHAILSDGAMNGLVNSLNAQNTSLFEVQGTMQAQVFDILPNQMTSNIPGQNPANGNGWNNNIPAPGVQQQGHVGSFGTFGPVSNVEFMWDLYRIQAKNNIPGQYGYGNPVRESEYIGTLVLDNGGNVSFVTVPEPSSALLIGLAGLVGLVGLSRRRRK